MPQFKLLGSLEIYDDSALSDVMKSPKGCAIVAYLLVNEGWQTRETVADLLWEATSTAQALKNLRNLLSRVRRSIPELQVTRKAIAFEPQPTSVVDLFQLRTGLTSDDLPTLDKALRHYRGELLSDFYVPDAPRFNEWLTVVREQLQRQVSNNYRRLWAGYKTADQWSDGIEATRRWVAVDHFNEEAHRALIELLVAAGQVTAALKQYEACRQLLWKELGVDPAEATQALASQIEQLEPSVPTLVVPSVDAVWAGDVLPDPAPLPPKSLLPYRRNDDFIGRKSTLHTIAEHLLLTKNPAKPPTVAICGMGGIGKTQLAVEFAYRFGRYFKGVYWLSFAQADGVMQEIAAVGTQRGMQLFHQTDKLPLEEQVDWVQQAWQADTPHLLIFDNCEDEELLAKWRPVMGGCRILITSRRGQWAEELDVTAHQLQQLERDESIALLLRLSPAVAPAELDAIAAELGDLPLALQLAGGFLNRYPHISAAQYVAQLRDRDLLRHPSLAGRGSNRSPTEHDLHIGRTFAINFIQLDPARDTDSLAIQLLTLIACFAHGEPIPQNVLLPIVVADEHNWIAEVKALDALKRLDTLGFIDQKGNENVVMHRLIAAFVQVQSADEQQQQALDIVAGTLAQLLAEEHTVSHYLGVLPLADTHVRHVVGRGLEGGTQNGARLGTWFGQHLIDIAAFAEAEPYLKRAVAISRRLQPHEALLLAESLNTYGTLHVKQQSYRSAESLYREAYEIYRREFGDDHIKTINLLNNLAIIEWRNGRLIQAKELFEQALRGHKKLQPPREQLMIRVLQNLGIVHSLLGAYAQAQACQARALTILHKTLASNHPQLADTYNSLGMNAMRQGDYATALTYFRQMLAIREEAFEANTYFIGSAHQNIGVALTQSGQAADAMHHLELALKIKQDTLPHDLPNLARSRAGVGFAKLQMADFQGAATLLAQTLAIQEQAWPTSIPTAETLVWSADLAMQQNDLATAHTLLARADAIYTTHNVWGRHRTALYLNSAGELAAKLGDVASARRYFEQVIQLLTDKVFPSHFELKRAIANLTIVARAVQF